MKPGKSLIVGCNGSGMRGLAELFCDLGVIPDGVDDRREENPFVNYLGPVSSIDLMPYSSVILSSAVLKNKDFAEKLKSAGKQTTHRFQCLLEIAKDKKIVLIAGSHGKSSVTAMISYVCKSFLPVSYYIGAKRLDEKRYAKFNPKGEFFVIESDESDGSFLRAKPFLSVVTSVDHEHLELWRVRSCLKWAFWSLKLTSREFISLESDLSENSSFARVVSFISTESGTEFELIIDGIRYGGFVPFIGEQFAFNSLLTCLALRAIGLHPREVLDKLETYCGLARRMERICLHPIVISDYAHHPTELRVVVNSIKKVFPNLVVFYQPHRVNRLKNTLQFYNNIFSGVKAFILPIFEPGLGEIKNDLAGILADLSKGQLINEFEIEFEKFLNYQNIILIAGAGDIDERARRVLSEKFNL